MVTLACLFAFLGFWCMYQTSQKAVYSRKNVSELWMNHHPAGAKLIGSIVLLGSLLVFMVHIGVGAGIFSFFVALMTFGSLIVLLAPIRIIRYRAFALMVIVAFLLETFS